MLTGQNRAKGSPAKGFGIGNRLVRGLAGKAIKLDPAASKFNKAQELGTWIRFKFQPESQWQVQEL